MIAEVSTIPDRRSARDHGPFSGYCKVCWNPVYVLWADVEPPPANCILGATRAEECADALGRARSIRDLQVAKAKAKALVAALPCSE